MPASLSRITNLPSDSCVTPQDRVVYSETSTELSTYRPMALFSFPVPSMPACVSSVPVCVPDVVPSFVLSAPFVEAAGLPFPQPPSTPVTKTSMRQTTIIFLLFMPLCSLSISYKCHFMVSCHSAFLSVPFFLYPFFFADKISLILHPQSCHLSDKFHHLNTVRIKISIPPAPCHDT